MTDFNYAMVLVLPVCLFVIVGLFSFYKVKTLNDFFYGPTALSPFGFAVITCGTNFSFVTAISVLLFWSYTFGLGVGLFVVFTGVVGVAVFGYLVRHVEAEKLMNSNSLHHFIAEPFENSQLLRALAAMVSIVGLVGFLIAATYFLASVLGAILNVNAHLVILTLCLPVTAYVMAGGFDAMRRTELLQFLLLVLGVIALLYVSYEIGETAIPADVSEMSIELAWPGLGLLAAIFITNAFYQFGATDMWQRAIASRAPENVKWGTRIAALFFLLLACAVSYAGYSLRLTSPSLGDAATDPVTLVITVINANYWAGLVIVVFMISAYVSTFDTTLLAVSQTFYCDFVFPFRKREVDWNRKVGQFGIERFVVLLCGIFVAAGASMLLENASAENVVNLLFSLFSLQLLLVSLLAHRLFFVDKQWTAQSALYPLLLMFFSTLGIGLLFQSHATISQWVPVVSPIVLFLLVVAIRRPPFNDSIDGKAEP